MRENTTTPGATARVAKIVNPGSDRHRKQLERLAEFVDADEIEYVDTPRGWPGEDYIIRKGDRTLTLHVRGNRDQDSFLSVSNGAKRA